MKRVKVRKSRLVFVTLTLLMGTVESVGSPISSEVEATGLPKRISSKILDLSKVYPIYMVAGMATLIELPGPVTGIRIGNPSAVRYFRPDRPESEVTLVLQSPNAQPTNLILRSGRKKYVFDIVPSRSVHQDTLEVSGDYGGAELDDPGAVLLDSSESARELRKSGRPANSGVRVKHR